MAVITRISRLFKADFHAVLDQVEEPRILLQQAIRDMEEDLSKTERRQQQASNDKQELGLRKDELAQSLLEVDGQLDVCFDSGKEDLARDLIKRKLQTQRLSTRVAAHLGAADREYQRLGNILDENRASLESLRQKAELFAERATRNHRDQNVVADLAWSPRELSVSDSDVEVALLQEKKRRDRA